MPSTYVRFTRTHAHTHARTHTQTHTHTTHTHTHTQHTHTQYVHAFQAVHTQYTMRSRESMRTSTHMYARKHKFKYMQTNKEQKNCKHTTDDHQCMRKNSVYTNLLALPSLQLVLLIVVLYTGEARCMWVSVVLVVRVGVWC